MASQFVESYMGLVRVYLLNPLLDSFLREFWKCWYGRTDFCEPVPGMRGRYRLG